MSFADAAETSVGTSTSPNVCELPTSLNGTENLLSARVNASVDGLCFSNKVTNEYLTLAREYHPLRLGQTYYQ